MAKTMRTATGVAAVAAMLTGCSVTMVNSTPEVSAADLEKGISEQLEKSGTTPKFVNCKDDLVGEVGKTATCKVLLPDESAFHVDITATKVEGGKVDYVSLVSLSQPELENAVKGMTTAESVNCEAGLNGTAGARTQCHITKDGTAYVDTVSVKKVDGLIMRLALGKATEQP